jgi:hydrogenase maturation protein HypF
MQASSLTTRIGICVTGIVQGVGFRPFVYQLAIESGLYGFVRNNNGQVEIEVEGAKDAVDGFVTRLRSEAPPLACITGISTTILPVVASISPGFSILESRSNGNSARFVPPDTATCAQCVAELLDPQDRRYRYPFINCTNCGPRFTIINSLPYDRPATTMRSFIMCPACQTEYEDPANRRFHAQPNACHQCGPSLSWHSPERKCSGEDAIREALRRIGDAEVIAVKGLGGYHLMADACSSSALQKIRQRKLRQRKPFAVMMTDLHMVQRHCIISEREATELLDASRPIVLLRRKVSSNLPDDIAPGLNYVGVMLPYTPLHHILLSEHGQPLIATSGNLSQEPIVIDNDEARERLASIACGFLEHNREICARYDDSVCQFIDAQRTVLRRSRGLAPKPIKLPFKATRSVLACGAHLKNTFCLIRQDQAYISQHIGDLDSIESSEHFESALATYLNLFDLNYDLIARDEHPDYLSSSIAEMLARKRNISTIPTQHHHAHIVSCMVENGLKDKVIGVAFDGLGLGTDGTLWGGEFMLSTFESFRRVGHFEPVPMPGGSQAIKQPWRMALGHLVANGSNFTETFAASLEDKCGNTAVKFVLKQIANGINSPLTSSCGRLFDAVSALLNICIMADYEGQPAMELESLAAELSLSADELIDLIPYPFEILSGETLVIKTSLLLDSVYKDLRARIPRAKIAARFHRTICEIVLDVCGRIRRLTACNDVCLTGGVFQNRMLLSMLLKLLPAQDFNIYIPKLLPANDGGLSLGQAVIALAQAKAIAPDHNEEIV